MIVELRRVRALRRGGERRRQIGPIVPRHVDVAAHLPGAQRAGARRMQQRRKVRLDLTQPRRLLNSGLFIPDVLLSAFRPGAIMASYRFYWFGPNGHIRRGEDVECASDDEARELAASRQGEFTAVEVWVGTRMVARIGVPDPGSKGS